MIALNSANGAIRWSRDLPSPSESSPLVDHGTAVLRLPERHRLRARTTADGSVLWTYHAAGAVKASPTLSDGVLYFGDYSGHVQAVSEQTGRRLWISGSEGALLGSGTFYSTAAVVYGRVFLGNTDGRVYAYDASTGKLDWAVQTGAYVYASPAVTNAPGLGPTVYLGSYNGTFYALNARSGQIDWSFDAHGRISGSATIVGRIVYFADLGQHRTYGLGISTGRVLFEMDTGSFDPVISDGTTSTSPATPACTRSRPAATSAYAPEALPAARRPTAAEHVREQVARHRHDPRVRRAAARRARPAAPARARTPSRACPSRTPARPSAPCTASSRDSLP